ncbi:hypothetical protein V2J09_006221 [Rumex salicifolius]
MESDDRIEPQTATEYSCLSPAPNLRSSSSLFKDISNFKTPKQPSTALPSHVTTSKLFTASKRTPFSSFTAAGSRTRRPSMAPTTAATSKSKAARRLKVLELQQSQSCRKELIKKEKSMKSLASSLTAWLNFLLDNPNQCGCGDTEVSVGVSARSRIGKRESWVRKREQDALSVDGLGRWPKRQRDGSSDCGDELEISSSQFANLQKSLSQLCSFEDLKRRMREYLSLSTCKEIFNVMTRLTKNIDEGRLKMKPNCPLVTDLGLKEKAIKTLLSYNSLWLRIGLYIIFGGESLLIDGSSGTDEEFGFLKMVIEKQLFSHSGLAKSFAYNKLVEGLYKPGYFEMLGNVILKRFLLLVLLLDKAKTQSSLPNQYGLDGLDGGSPLLFSVQYNIKSSQQMITDFLIAEVMHGEGNLLAHLVMIGYRVSYEQLPLLEYNFKIEDLFQDIQDGVKLCRAVQLLQNDSSVLMKVVLPAGSLKKRLANCYMALQYLKKAGVPLYDEDGMSITGDDISNGDKELTLSLLWNVFVHLQIPLLITKYTLYDEICKISKADSKLKDMECSSHLDMLLHWIKAICENYGYKNDKLNSVVDGKSIWCLLDFYFHKELTCVCSTKDMGGTSVEESVVSSVDSSDAVHNFVLSQKITTLLGNVLQTSDILEYNGPCNNRSVLLLLVFMSTQLLVKKSKYQLNFHKLLGCRCQALERRPSSLDRLSKKIEAKFIKDDDSQETIADAARKFKAVKAWWQEMAKKNSDYVIESMPPLVVSNIPGEPIEEGLNLRCDRKTKKGCIIMGLNTHLYHQEGSVFSQSQQIEESAARVIQRLCRGYQARKRFENQKQAVIRIQRVLRSLSLWRNCNNEKVATRSAIVIQSCLRGLLARKDASRRRHFVIVIQLQEIKESAARVIQRHFRGYQARKHFQNWKQVVITIQRILRSLSLWRNYNNEKVATRSAIVIQSCLRGLLARKDASRRRHFVIVIQSNIRCWSARRVFLSQKSAAMVIQSSLRAMLCSEAIFSYRQAAIEIQRIVRGRITRTRLLGATCTHAVSERNTIVSNSGNQTQTTEKKKVLHATVKLQRWWRRIKMFKSQMKAAVVIQSHFHGWIARRRVARENRLIVLIQANWKGYIVRRDAKGQQLVELRRRLQESTVNVDDGMRLINRHIAALSELLGMKSLSNILRNCATLDKATGLSSNCCEILVDAGAIDILLKQIKGVSRSIPDKEILKHSLSILRNLARYPHLADILINHKGSVETILWEMLRNKEEGYYIVCDLLKKICNTRKGVEAMHRLPFLLKRLSALVDEMSRKAGKEKRSLHHQRITDSRNSTERRLKEAVEIIGTIRRGRD